MSTKTNFKRVALVAVAALGAGLLSVAPATAAVGTADGDMAVQTTTITGTYGTVGTAVTSDGAQTISITTNGRVALGINGASGAHVNLTGPCYFTTQLNTGAVSTSDLTISNGGLTATAAADTYVSIVPTAVGTCVAKGYAAASEAATADKVTITILAASSIGTYSAADSFASVGASAAGAEVTTSADTAANLRVANDAEGIINYTLHDANDVAMPSTTVVTATATGGAVVSFTSATYLGTSASVSYPTSDDYDTIYVAQGATNAAQDASVSIYVNGVLWTTKSLQLLGDAATVTLANYLGVHGEVSVTSTSGAFVFNVKDSLGRYLTSKALTWTAASNNTSVTPQSATTGASTSTSTAGSFACSAVKGSNKIQAYLRNTAGNIITSNALEVFCVGAAYSYSAALDKAVYVPGDIATLTITAKDSAGNPASDISEVGAAAAIAASNMTAVTALTSVDTFTAGVKKYSFIVGSTEGSYSMSVSLTDIDDAVTVPFSIKSNSTAVSNADVLKAIVSLIASINKQIAALQKALLKK